MDNTKPYGSTEYALERGEKRHPITLGHKDIPFFLTIFFILLSIEGYALTDGGSRNGRTLPEGANVGICIRTASGKTLEEVNADRNFIPASTLKAVTIASALKSLGDDFRFETRIAYSGEIDGAGVLRGDLYIIGGADPTLGSPSPIAMPKDSLFTRWERAVRSAGIRRIEGAVVGDSRGMETQVNRSWLYEDLGTYYGTSCSGLMFNENRLELTINPSAGKEGAAVRVQGAFREKDGTLVPDTRPWMRIENACTIGQEGSGDQTYLLTSEFAPAGRLVGTYAAGKKPKKVAYNDPFADFSCAYEFAMFLYRNGIPCSAVTSTSSCHPTAEFAAKASGIAPAPVLGFRTFDTEGALTYGRKFVPQDSLRVLSSTKSPKLGSIARETLRQSDNLFAETLLRAQSYKSPNATFLGATESLEIERRTLERMGVSTSGVKIEDGSGLSRKNSVSPEFMTAVLKAMLQQKCFGKYLLSFNTPGPDERLLSNAPAEIRRRIRLKSGSMGGVLCYVGYILPASEISTTSTADTSKTSTKAGKTQDSPGRTKQAQETTVFSIMINGATQSSAELRSFIESVLLEYLQ